ncbi:MAG: hypothetical protein UT08_C0008G0008 [Candidatus Woesebacteria bacterium GW2011_GWB1_38_8]|uniref:Uncharacterized protein n=1 Tax=Candidatus Woesebacteria bacterium GW2011_GWB1_38_8 TaxID=1618570 RepID=A0A0G0L2M1_9BACT|nr:MAG: hypothetical protein UT08_C0008G0008 [Candidatus Woesebacteria bacterium GW2011_GWB1_38_8]
MKIIVIIAAVFSLILLILAIFGIIVIPGVGI